MAGVPIDFIPNFEDLQDELEDEDFEAEVDLQGEGTGTGGAGGGSGGGAMSGLLGAEAGSDIATGPGGAGLAGRAAGGGGASAGALAGGAAILAVVALLAVAVAFLAKLEPIQQAVGFIMRMFELAVIPFVAALGPVMAKIEEGMGKLIQAFNNPDKFASKIGQSIKRILAQVANSIIGVLNSVPGVNMSPVNVPGAPSENVNTRGQTTSTQQQTQTRSLMGSALGFSMDPAGFTGDVMTDMAFSELSDEGQKNKNLKMVESLTDLFF